MGFIVSALKKIIDKGLEDNAPENFKEVVKKASAGDAGEHLKNYVIEKSQKRRTARRKKKKYNQFCFFAWSKQKRYNGVGV